MKMLLIIALVIYDRAGPISAADPAINIVQTGVCTGAYCDPSYLPYPNMNAALYGYDLIKADPFSTARLGGDPGWRNALFFATTGSEFIRGAIQLHKSVEARDVLQCAAKFQQKDVTNLKKYKEEQLKSSYSGYDLKIGNEIEVEVGVEVPLGDATGSASAKTTIPPFLTRSSSNTESESKLSEFFSKEGGSMVVLEASCSVHVVDLVPNIVPLFNEGFARAIGNLAAAQTEDARKFAFKQFYDHYGTHYSQRTTMGSKLIYSLRISRNERSNKDKKEISKCANVQGLKVFGVQAEPNTEKCNNESEYKSSLDSSNVGRESYASYGSKPASTLSEWAKQTFDRPMPLTMQLVPLPRLFTKRNLEAVSKITNTQIDQKALLDWYLPMWEKFCSAINIPCEQDKEGCGYNDKCTWDQICLQPVNNPRRYECLKTTPCNKLPANIKGSVVYGGGNDLGDKIGHGGTSKVNCNNGFSYSYFLAHPGATFTCKSGSWLPFTPDFNVCRGLKSMPVTQKSTNCFQSGKGVIFLDQHTLDCGGGDTNLFLNQFSISDCGNWQMKYNYKCIGGGATNKQCFQQATDCKDRGDGPDGVINYLDQHNVDCSNRGKGYYLNKYHMVHSSCPNGQVRYEYTCCAPEQTPVNEFCWTKSTQCQHNGGANGNKIWFLHKHNVDCDGRYLKRIKLVNCGNDNVKYDFTCCEYVSLWSHAPSLPTSLQPIQKSTNCDVSHEGLVYLDRYPLDCGDDTNLWLTEFQAKGCGSAKMKIDYKCGGGRAANKECYTSNTNCNDRGGGDGRLQNMDRHDVNCNSRGKGYYLNKYHLVPCPNNQVRFDYTCCKAERTLIDERCEQKSTPCQDEGANAGDQIAYLDRHYVNCDGKYLKKIQMQRCDAHTIRYDYTCCVYV